MVKRKIKKVAKRIVKVHKRTGGHENFKPQKLFKSCYRAGLAAELGSKKAKSIAQRCVTAVRTELRKHKHITSHEIRAMTLKILEKYNKDAALMYRAIREVG